MIEINNNIFINAELITFISIAVFVQLFALALIKRVHLVRLFVEHYRELAIKPAMKSNWEVWRDIILAEKYCKYKIFLTEAINILLLRDAYLPNITKPESLYFVTIDGDNKVVLKNSVTNRVVAHKKQDKKQNPTIKVIQNTLKFVLELLRIRRKYHAESGEEHDDNSKRKED